MPSEQTDPDLIERLDALHEAWEALQVSAERVLKERDAALKRVAELEENCPFPWCPECGVECRSVDEDGCCSGCGVEPIWPTAAMVGRAAALEGAVLHLNRHHPAACECRGCAALAAGKEGE